MSARKKTKRANPFIWETLEDRVVLSSTTTIVPAASITMGAGISPATSLTLPLTVTGTDANDTLTLSTAANHVTTINLNGTTTTATGSGTLTVALKGGNNTINILSSFTDVKIVVVGGENGGHNAVNVGTTNHDLTSAPFGQVVVQAVDSLTVDDSADTAARTIAFAAPHSDVTAITAPGLPEIDYNPTANVVYRSGNGGNSIRVTAGTYGAAAGSLSLFGGNGADQVSVQAVNGSFSYDGVAGTDSIFFGQPGSYGMLTSGYSLDSIIGPVTVGNSGGTLALSLNDSTSATAKTFSVGSTGIYGLLAQPITMSRLSSLSVTTSGVGGNLVTVGSTNAPTSIIGAGRVSNNFVAEDQIFVGGNNSVQQISAPLTIVSSNFTPQVAIDDSADPTARTAKLLQDASNHQFAELVGLAPAPIFLRASSSISDFSLTVSLGKSQTSLSVIVPPNHDSLPIIGLNVYGQSTNDHNSLLVDYSGIPTDTTYANQFTLDGKRFYPWAGFGVSFNLVSSLQIKGTSAPDVFHVKTPPPTASTISLDGGGNDTLDFSDDSYNLNVNLATHTASAFVGTFANFTTIIGGTGSNTLTGPTAGSTFNINGKNSGNVGGVAFSNFGTMVGQAGNDTFAFGPAGQLTGNIDGGGGVNTIDQSAVTHNVNADLSVSTLTSVGGTFAKINTLKGGTGSNALTGYAAGTTFNINGQDTGNVNNGAISFVNYATMVGLTGDDVFKFIGAGSGLSGSIYGGQGVDTLDYSGRAAGINVNLASGQANLVAAGVGAMENVIGGSGNDTIVGGGAGGILIGGTGNDNITAGTGRSILIGGTGVDTLVGGSGDDIVIGGSTSFDGNIAALDTILAEWRSLVRAYAARVANIKNGGGLNGTNTLVLGTTVIDDGAANSLTGGAGTNWFFKGTNDQIKDLKAGEQVN